MNYKKEIVDGVEWILDENNNRASITNTRTEKDCIENLTTLRNCIDCKNCMACEGCTSCANCDLCQDCTNCVWCRSCANCVACEECINCRDAIGRKNEFIYGSLDSGEMKSE